MYAIMRMLWILNASTCNMSSLASHEGGCSRIVALFKQTNKQTNKQTKTNKQTWFPCPCSWANISQCILTVDQLYKYVQVKYNHKQKSKVPPKNHDSKVRGGGSFGQPALSADQPPSLPSGANYQQSGIRNNFHLKKVCSGTKTFCSALPHSCWLRVESGWECAAVRWDHNVTVAPKANATPA